MKTKFVLLNTLLTTVWLAGASAASGAPNNGTSILHWTVGKAMVQDGGETNAVGQVNGRHTRQGRADHQRLELFLRQLETNGNYHVLALLGDDTNWTYVAPVMADGAGSVNLRYRYSATGNGRLGRVFTALPDVLKPVSNVRQVAVANSNMQAVLVADLTMPDKIQYLVKRPLNNDGVEPNATGTVWVRANNLMGSVRLQTRHLGTNSNYLIALDGNAMFSATTDAVGRLNVHLSGINPVEVLNLRSVAVWNSENNSVLSATLP